MQTKDTEEKKENKERVVLKQTLEMLMEAVYSKNPAKITKAYAKYYKNIQQELDRAREEAVLKYILSLGWQDTDNEYVKEVLEDAEKIADKLY